MSRAYVAGIEWDDDTGYGFKIIAYNTMNGQILWQDRYDGTAGESDFVSAIKLSPNGSRLVVTGTAMKNLTSTEWVTIAYDTATGARVWLSTFDGVGGGLNRAQAISVHPNGNRVFVTGLTQHNDQVIRIATLAYDMLGEIMWHSEYQGPANIDASQAIASRTGSVVVAGWGFGTNATTDIVTMELNGFTGEIRWTARYEGAGPETLNMAQNVVIDNTRAFVVGESESGFGTVEYVTLAYELGSGDALWENRYSGAESSWNRARAAALSPNGDRLYIVGEILLNSTALNYGTIALNANTGGFIWDKLYAGASQDWNSASRIAVGQIGSSVHVVGITQQLGGSLEHEEVAYRAADGLQLGQALYGEASVTPWLHYPSEAHFPTFGEAWASREVGNLYLNVAGFPMSASVEWEPATEAAAVPVHPDNRSSLFDSYSTTPHPGERALDLPLMPKDILANAETQLRTEVSIIFPDAGNYSDARVLHLGEEFQPLAQVLVDYLADDEALLADVMEQFLDGANGSSLPVLSIYYMGPDDESSLPRFLQEYYGGDLTYLPDLDFYYLDESHTSQLPDIFSDRTSGNPDLGLLVTLAGQIDRLGLSQLATTPPPGQGSEPYQPPPLMPDMQAYPMVGGVHTYPAGDGRWILPAEFQAFVDGLPHGLPEFYNFEPYDVDVYSTCWELLHDLGLDELTLPPGVPRPCVIPYLWEELVPLQILRVGVPSRVEDHGHGDFVVVCVYPFDLAVITPVPIDLEVDLGRTVDIVQLLHEDSSGVVNCVTMVWDKAGPPVGGFGQDFLLEGSWQFAGVGIWGDIGPWWLPGWFSHSRGMMWQADGSKAVVDTFSLGNCFGSPIVMSLCLPFVWEKWSVNSPDEYVGALSGAIHVLLPICLTLNIAICTISIVLQIIIRGVVTLGGVKANMSGNSYCISYVEDGFAGKRLSWLAVRWWESECLGTQQLNVDVWGLVRIEIM